MEWKIKKKRNTTVVGLFTKYPQKCFYEFEMNGTDIFEHLNEDTIDQEMLLENQRVRETIIEFFSTKENLEVEDNKDKHLFESNKNQLKLPADQSKWSNYIQNVIVPYLNHPVQDPLLLLLMQRFLHYAHLLGDPFTIKGLSENEQVTEKLRVYLLKLRVYQLLMESSAPEIVNMKERIERAYYTDWKKFSIFVHDSHFQNFILPDDLAMFFSPILKKKDKRITIDHVVNYTVDSFLATYNHKEDKHTLNQHVMKIVNGFHLPRYNVLHSVVKHIKYHKSGIFNIFIPRLLASIIIGLIPVLLTGEIYEWYLAEFMIKKPNEALFFSYVTFSELFILVYLYIEVKNHLGYFNFASFFKIGYLFLMGNLLSFFLSFLGSKHFSYYFIASKITNLEDPVNYYPMMFWGVPLSLIILQSTSALLFGIILQTIWEDKPVTQPL